MKKPFFQGVCTALVTPFLNGEVNYPMLEQLLRRQIDAGIKTVAIAGTTGEAPTLSHDEKLTMFRRAKAFTGDDCTIIAGTGCNSTAATVSFSQEAQEQGVDGLLVVSPYYNKATADGLVAHYLTIANAVSIPIIMYNVPSRTGIDIPVNVYHRLSQVPNIAGTKEASREISKVTHICRSCPLPVWTGNDDHTVAAVALGAQGVISVLSNILPEETQSMTLAALDGDLDSASSLQQKLQPIIDLLFCESNPIPVKAILRHLGYDCGCCRLPLTELSPENRNRIRAYFQ